MLTPSESNDFQRGFFQLDQSFGENNPSTCWDLSHLLSLSIQQVSHLEDIFNDSDESKQTRKTNEGWHDPYWEAYKFDEPRTIPRCWDISALY
jgi:hypothetical protein